MSSLKAKFRRWRQKKAEIEQILYRNPPSGYSEVQKVSPENWQT
jgi:hypothetical protein